MVLGIDAGGTKTVGLLSDGSEQVLAQARGPGANLAAMGELEIEKVLHQVISDVLSERHLRIDAICLGMAGVDRPQEAAVVLGILMRIGQRARALVVNDALIALEAGAPVEPGIVIIAGTGSIAYGRTGLRAARSGGWGHVLADEGSGYWLGRQALRAVMREADGRGPKTALSQRLFAHYDVTRAQDLVREIYPPGGLRPTAIATLAGHVQGAAEEGDATASLIISVGAAELATAAESVARRLGLFECAIVLAGGIFRGVPLMRESLIRRLGETLPGSAVRSLEAEPALGAIRLAIRLVDDTLEMPAYVDNS